MRCCHLSSNRETDTGQQDLKLGPVFWGSEFWDLSFWDLKLGSKIGT
jgi:hypothetical protein